MVEAMEVLLLLLFVLMMPSPQGQSRTRRDPLGRGLDVRGRGHLIARLNQLCPQLKSFLLQRISGLRSGRITQGQVWSQAIEVPVLVQSGDANQGGQELHLIKGMQLLKQVVGHPAKQIFLLDW